MRKRRDLPPPKASGELDDEELKELVLKIVREEKPGSVGELAEIMLGRMEISLSASEVARLVQELEEGGRIKLSETPRAFQTFMAYLMDRDCSLPFWLVVIAIALTWASIYVIPSEFPWVIPRWALGTLFVIFLPGYAFIEALFVNPLSGKKELDQIERFALSIGMSLALVPIVGLLLNYTPWGIRLEPITISLSVLTLVCILVAVYRRFSQTSAARLEEA